MSIQLKRKQKPYWRRWISWYFLNQFRSNACQRAEWSFEIAARRLQPGEIAVDCGANTGVFTEVLAAQGATVYAFEPDPYAFELLSERVGAKPNVVLRQKAVGVCDGTFPLYRAVDFEINPVERTQASSLLPFKPNVTEESSIEVSQIDFVAFVRELESPIKIFKIDIEGAEFDLLRALIEADLAEGIEHVFVETHDAKIPELRNAAAVVRSLIEARGLKNVNLDWK